MKTREVIWSTASVATLGGRLTLTNERLVFQPHKFNFRKENKDIPVVDVKQVVRGDKHQNVLLLTLNNNEKHRFVVEWPSRWMEAFKRYLYPIPYTLYRRP